MIRHLAILIVALATTAATAMSQQNLWHDDATLSPVVHDDGRVTLRLYAPMAESVMAVGDFAADGVDMERRDDGMWETTLGPLPSELYSYSFTVDGVTNVCDPSNAYAMRDVGRQMSYFIVAGERGDLYRAQAVAHGTVSRMWMTTDEGSRRMTIYTPAGYEDGDSCYPTLYLLHGMGGDEESWLATGRVAEIMDNLIAQGAAEPMIVVMPNGCMQHASAPGYSHEGMWRPYMSGSMDGSFERHLAAVVAWTDEHFRTLACKTSRAVAGLSMGGFHALHASHAYPALFDYVGLFSAAIFRGAEGVAMYEDMPAGLAALFHQGVRLYWVGIGRDDFLYEENRTFRAMLDAAGYEYVYYESAGGHTWRNWRVYLTEFAKQLFND